MPDGVSSNMQGEVVVNALVIAALSCARHGDAPQPVKRMLGSRYAASECVSHLENASWCH